MSANVVLCHVNVYKKNNITCTEIMRDVVFLSQQILVESVKSDGLMECVHFQDSMSSGIIQNLERDRQSLKITCKEARQAEQLKTLTEFAGIAVKVSQYDPDKRRKKAVIKVNTDIEERDLLEILKKENVVAVKRFKKRIERKLRNTPSVVIIFERKEIPNESYFAYERYKVFEYPPPIL